MNGVNLIQAVPEKELKEAVLLMNGVNLIQAVPEKELKNACTDF